MLSESIILFFRTLGPIGMILSFSIIIYLDGLMMPMLPEAWLFFIVVSNTSPHWFLFGMALVIAGILAAVGAQVTLFSIVKKTGIPKFITKIMRKYTEVLIVSSEKLMFFNWMIPVLPATGAFVAVKKEWKPKIAFFYSLLGGAVKMPILVCIAFAFPLLVSANDLGLATLIFVIAAILVSLATTFLAKRRLLKKGKQIL